MHRPQIFPMLLGAAFAALWIVVEVAMHVSVINWPW